MSEAAMGRCRDCRWWAERENGESCGGWGDCTLAEGVGETGWPVHLESLCTAWTPEVAPAYLRTKAAFGCIQWARRETEAPT